MNNQLKACLAGAFILLITLLLLSKCTRCRDERPPEVAVAAPAPAPPQQTDNLPDVSDIGGTGDLKITLTWEFPGDIDVHVTEPSGEVINFMNKNDYETGGNLDVDNLQGGSPGNPAAENVYWPHPPAGRYHVMVKYYGERQGVTQGTVNVTVINNGQRSDYRIHLDQVGQEVDVVDIDYRPRQ